MNVDATTASRQPSSHALSIKRLGKRAVRTAGLALPRPAFHLLVRVARAVYGATSRIGYRLRLLTYRVTDREAYETACAVWDVLPYTFVGIGGLEVTYHAARRVNAERRPGAFVELGVARGGCAALLAKQAFADPDLRRSMWLFDSFEGLPDPTADDLDPARGSGTGDHVTPLARGSCLGTIEDVQWLLFERFKLPRERVTLVKGWFQDTLPVHAKRIGPIALLRIDGDWYESTKVCLDHLYDEVVVGGAVIVDDYESCFGCAKAVDEFLGRRQIVVDLHLDGRGGCYFVKP